MVKTSSIDRVFSQFRGMDIKQISLVQALYQKRDAQGIKNIFNNPGISDATALAYGRLSSQYINYLNNPSKTVINRVKKKYGIVLTPNYNQNLTLMGNTPATGGSGAVKTGLKQLIKIIQLNPLNHVIRKASRYITIVSNPMAIASFEQDINLSAYDVVFLKAQGITNYRVFFKIKFKRGNTGWISTTDLIIPNYSRIRDSIIDIDIMISSADYYTYKELNDQVDSIIEIRVEWW